MVTLESLGRASPFRLSVRRATECCQRKRLRAATVMSSGSNGPIFPAAMSLAYEAESVRRCLGGESARAGRGGKSRLKI